MHSHTLLALRSFPEQLERCYSLIPENYANWAPPSWEGVPSEMFTPIEQICHVRDIEIDGYYVRFNRMLHEICPTLESIDGYVLAKQRRYAEADPGDVFSVFRRARSQTVELLAQVSDAELHRTGFFEGYGQVTVKALMHFLCSHDQQHLAGLQWLLGHIDSDMVDAARKMTRE